MKKVWWSVFWSLLLAAVGVWASRVVWLAVGLATVAFFSLSLAVMPTDAVAAASGSVSRERRSRRKLLIGAFTVFGALCGLVGSKLALHFYDVERQQAENERAEKEALRRDLSAAQQELAQARARSEAAEHRSERQREKLADVNQRIAQAIDEGDGIRYRFEHARRENQASFAAKFRAVLATAIETWRARTAAMLDEELPHQRLGASFSAVTGERVGRPDVYELTRLLACIGELRTIQRNLPDYVERVIQLAPEAQRASLSRRIVRGLTLSSRAKFLSVSA